MAVQVQRDGPAGGDHQGGVVAAGRLHVGGQLNRVALLQGGLEASPSGNLRGKRPQHRTILAHDPDVFEVPIHEFRLILKIRFGEGLAVCLSRQIIAACRGVPGPVKAHDAARGAAPGVVLVLCRDLAACAETV